MSQIFAARRPGAAGAESSIDRQQEQQQQQQQRMRVASSSSTASGSSEAKDAAVEFAHRRDALISSIEVTNSLVSSLSEYNDSKWTLHYPSSKLGFVDSQQEGNEKAVNASSAIGKVMRAEPRRSASMFGEESSSSSGPASAPVTPARPSHQRAFSTMTPSLSTPPPSFESSLASTTASASTTSHPLAIDLRLGAPGQTAATRLMDSMSQETIAQILSKRFDNAISQLSSLNARVRDNQSRILVTGDVNAGKSTFVNALLRRDILPTDQQPLTTVFCEVLDAQAYNHGKEEVHAILQKDLQSYSRGSKDTFERFDLDKLEDIATDEEQRYAMVKIYLEDSRAPISSTQSAVVDQAIPAEVEAETNKSFIRNGIVSISLIDGPGLNIDSLKTTAVFARQSEIDVVVFVATATEYLTESGKNFLFTAGMEKAYIFIVVNKFETLRNKEKARKNILEQIKRVSPKTWENREELVHFVEAANVLKEVNTVLLDTTASATPVTPAAAEVQDPAFAHLEESLRSFLLLKRSISKLAPAKHYLVNLLADLEIVAEANILAAGKEFDEAEERLALVKPIHEKLSKEREVVEEAVGAQEEETVSLVRKTAGDRLKLAVDGVAAPASQRRQPEYPGLLGIWDWANSVKASLVEFLEEEIWAAEEEAKKVTIEGVQEVTGGMAKRFLPVVDTSLPSSAGGAASALPQRVFNSEAMFSKRRQAALRRKKEKAAVPVPSSTSSDIEMSFMDLLDLDKLMSMGTFAFRTPGGGASSKLGDPKALMEAGSALSMVSLGFGAVTMFGTKVVGVKSVIEAITSLCEVLGSKAARKWAGPIAGVLTLALGAYIIHDLPRAIPHNIGKKLHSQLLMSEFSTIESERIAGETRRVMRMAGWDLRERFRAALEASEKDRKEVEDKMEKADEAMIFLDRYLEKVAEQQRGVVAVEL